MISPFLAFMLWLGACWLVVQLTAKPLQPDQLVDDLTDVDMADVQRQRVIREWSHWLSCWAPSWWLCRCRRRRPRSSMRFCILTRFAPSSSSKGCGRSAGTGRPDLPRGRGVSEYEFPRRHSGPFFKVKAHKEKRGKGPTAKRRAAKRRKIDAGELGAMQDARGRDEYCRFPLCGCRATGMIPRSFGGFDSEVSHAKHRGMGGNPEGDRTVPALLLLVCNWRHKLSKFSIDQKTIRWVPLTADGANGPIRWLIDVEVFLAHRLPIPVHIAAVVKTFSPIESDPFPFVEVARETAPHEYEPFTDAQKTVLDYLSKMTC